MQEPITKRVCALQIPERAFGVRPPEDVIAARQRKPVEIVEDAGYARSMQAGPGQVIQAMDNPGTGAVSQLSHGELLSRSPLNGLGYVAGEIVRALRAPGTSLAPPDLAHRTPVRRRRVFQ